MKGGCVNIHRTPRGDIFVRISFSVDGEGTDTMPTDSSGLGENKQNDEIQQTLQAVARTVGGG